MLNYKLIQQLAKYRPDAEICVDVHKPEGDMNLITSDAKFVVDEVESNDDVIFLTVTTRKDE